MLTAEVLNMPHGLAVWCGSARRPERHVARAAVMEQARSLELI
jgi:hypothetical protein